MKKLFLLSAFSLFVVNLYAQERHEISAGYGLGTSSDFLNVFSEVLATAITGGALTPKNESFSGAFHLTYKYLATDRLAIGGTFAYERSTADTEQGNTKIGKVVRNYYTVAAEADYRYIRKPSFSLYSGLGLGFTSHNEKYQPDGGAASSDNTGHFNFQVIGVGARFGARFGGFVEAGFGYKGVICAGAFARF